MKYIICFFSLLAISTAIGQTNPDGADVSIHLTPYFTTGEIFGAELDTEFCYKIEFVAPITDYTTVKLFYDYMNTTTIEDNSFYSGSNLIQLNKFGATLSFYFE